MKVRFLTSAMNDMKEIKEYISWDNPNAAKKLIKKIKNSTKMLEKFPYIGRIIPESQEQNLREILIGNYRIMYQISEKYINVFAVYEGHRKYIIIDKDKRQP